MILLSYSSDIDKSICESFNIDYSVVLLTLTKDPNLLLKNKSSSFKSISIAIARVTIAYSRIYINKIKDTILKKGGNIYYSNTDSIVTDIELSLDMINSKQIGKLKLKYKIKKGYFINAKIYCLVLDNGYVTKENKIKVIKAKGVKKNTLSESDFINMYNDKDIKTAILSASIPDYSKDSCNWLNLVTR